MKHLLILLSLLFITTSVNAKPSPASINVEVGTTITHFNSNKFLNEDNEIIAMQYNFKDSAWGVNTSTFNNSYYDRHTLLVGNTQ